MRVLERVADAWRSTPTKWYPLPWFVGACLLVFLQYRRNSKANKEVDVGEDGEHVVKLRGPWQVSWILCSTYRSCCELADCRRMLLRKYLEV